MTFPECTPVDDFNRADSALRGSNGWASGDLAGGSVSGPDIVSNELFVASADVEATAYRENPLTGTYGQVFALLGSDWGGGSVIELWLYQTVDASFDGYSAVFIGGSNWEIRKATAGGDSTVASGSDSPGWDAGSWVGMRRTASAVEIWAQFDVAKGSPKRIASYNDTDHYGPFYSGFYIGAGGGDNSTVTEYRASGETPQAVRRALIT